MEWVANGSDTFRGNSLKNDKQKRQHPMMGNWRDKNTYHSADLGGTIIPIGSHTFPEEGQGFF